jgi:hypothetical protein
MNQGQIEQIENQLNISPLKLDFEVDDDDLEYFGFPETKPLPFSADVLVRMVLGGALNEDYFSVDLCKFENENMCALVFNMGMAAGEYELMGLTTGLIASPSFVRNSLVRWTKQQNFHWTKNLDVTDKKLLPDQVLNEVRAINSIK